jgi:hypothetical protein
MIALFESVSQHPFEQIASSLSRDMFGIFL